MPRATAASGLDDEVAVPDGVERVGGHAVEAELRGRRLAVERVAGAGQRAGAQRRRRSARRRASARRPRSRSSISTYARRWWANRTGWAGWMWVCRAGRRRAPLGQGDERALDPTTRVEPSTARRIQSRRSVATWSLRERPVWSLPATAPSRSVRAASRLRWTSSSAGSQRARRPRRRRRRASSPATSVATSASASMPARPRPRTWAIEPSRSSAASSVDVDRRPKAATSLVAPGREPSAPEPHRPLRSPATALSPRLPANHAVIRQGPGR